MERSDLSVTKIKTFTGRQGEGYNCELRLRGAVIADVANMADGGETDFNWVAPDGSRRRGNGGAVEAELRQLLKTLPPFRLQGVDEPIAWSPGLLVEDMVSTELERRQLARACKTKTLFRLEGSAPEKYWEIRAPFTPAVAKYLRTKYGSELKEIINERFMPAAQPPSVEVPCAQERDGLDLSEGNTP